MGKFLPKFSGKFEVIKITVENWFKLQSLDDLSFITYQNRQLLNKCPDAGQPSPMQRRFRKWHYNCLRQAEAWKQRMLQYETSKPLTPKDIIETESNAESEEVELSPTKDDPKKKEIREEKLKEFKTPQQYKLRPRKKNINYKEKDIRCNEVVADAEVEMKRKKVKYVPHKEDEIFLTHLKEYWETRNYKTIELNERDVGKFSNQTQDTRWHDDKIAIYTDTACAGNGKDDCKAAYAIHLNEKSNYNRQACIKNPKDY